MNGNPDSQVRPVKLSLNHRVVALCRKPYPGHPHGCPNWNCRPTCPPGVPFLSEIIDLTEPVYCIHNGFDLEGHVSRMRERHPDWSQRQLRCCLYWQGTARKQLRRKAEAFLETHQEWVVLYAPEACGVDITRTMASVGIELEWPPKSVVYQVALAGVPHGDLWKNHPQFAEALGGSPK